MTTPNSDTAAAEPTSTAEPAAAKPTRGRAKTVSETVVDNVLEVKRGRVTICVVGETPLILNRMSQKARRELLLPRGKKTMSERATTLKHDPYEEFRASAYVLPDGPTLLGILATAFKKSMMTAALDLPGTKKAQIGRLTYVDGEHVSVFGVQRLFMSITRSADMARTPDVRTRAIVPEWAARLTVTFTKPLITEQAVVRLLLAAGMSVGVGDWRLEKGSGNYGLFRLVQEDDAEFQAIVAEGKRAVQEQAFETPVCHDDETAELLAWYDQEVADRRARGSASVGPAPTTRKRRVAASEVGEEVTA
jgi:hypothetical protein